MALTVNKYKSIVHSKQVQNKTLMTKAEMVQKILADQKVIRGAVKKGINLKELEKKHGFKFATLPPVKN